MTVLRFRTTETWPRKLEINNFISRNETSKKRKHYILQQNVSQDADQSRA